MSAITVDVLNWEKKKCGGIQLDASIFKESPRLDIMSEMVRMNQAARRQGSHNAKTRAEVRGGGAKPFRQKGTGRARQGSSRSPLLRAGGVIHGPKPRKYTKKVGAKVKKLGMRSALSYLFSKSAFVVVEDMVSKEGKTKALNQTLKKFSPKSLLVDDERDLLFSRACRNLPRYQLISAQGLNVYDLLKYEYVICTRKAVEKIHKIYGQDSRGSEEAKRRPEPPSKKRDESEKAEPQTTAAKQSSKRMK